MPIILLFRQITDRKRKTYIVLSKNFDKNRFSSRFLSTALNTGPYLFNFLFKQKQQTTQTTNKNDEDQWRFMAYSADLESKCRAAPIFDYALAVEAAAAAVEMPN